MRADVRTTMIAGTAIVVQALGAATAESAAGGGLVTGGLPNLATSAVAEASSAAGALGQKYGPQAVNDGKLDTRWADARNAALPQWVKLTFPQPAEIDTVVAVVADVPGLYAIPKRVVVEFPDGSSVDAAVPDAAGPVVLRFPVRTVPGLKVSIPQVHTLRMYVGFDEIMADLGCDWYVVLDPATNEYYFLLGTMKDWWKRFYRTRAAKAGK